MTWTRVKIVVDVLNCLAKYAVIFAAIAAYFDGRGRNEATRVELLEKIQTLEIKTEAVAHTIGVPAIPDAITPTQSAFEGEN